VIADSKALLAARSARVDGAFTLAEEWKARLLGEGWQQILPKTSGGCSLSTSSR
jgi:hypothetical protein